MASSARNPEYDAAYPSQRSHRDQMRAGYVLVSEERESGSEYSGSTCCYCSSCASSCSGDEDSGDEDDDEEQGYWSDCSECRARRSAERRGRTGWRDGDGASCGNGYVNSRRVAEGGDSHQDRHHHARHHGQHRHDGRNETRQRDQQSTSYAFRNNNSTNTGYSASEAPAFRGLVDRIVSTTRQLRQGEEHVHHLRSWIRVLEDIQRLQSVNAERVANLTAASASASAPPPPLAATIPVPVPVSVPAAARMAARTGQSSYSATMLGRESGTSSRAAAAMGEDDRVRQAQAQAYPRGTTRGYFMSGGRSISTNRRRRLR